MGNLEKRERTVTGETTHDVERSLPVLGKQRFFASLTSPTDPRVGKLLKLIRGLLNSRL